MRALPGKWQEPVKLTPMLLRPWVFRFPDVEHELAGPGDWNNPAHDKLWQPVTLEPCAVDGLFA